MDLEIFATTLNSSSSPAAVGTSDSFDFIAVGAVLISLFTLFFSIWQWSRTWRSEQIKISRELMYSIFECRQVLDAFFDRYNASPPKEDKDRKLRALEWIGCLGDLMYEIEEFRSFVTFQDIGKRIEILLGFENNTIHSRAQLTQALSDGPFPGVLLIPGSGAADMDEYLPPELAGVENGSRPFWQIANYLSERGFAVLRYDKRGVGENSTVIDANLLGNATVRKLQSDAEDALKVLLEEPEVDRNDITLIGHSEGAVIVPRIAAKQSEDVKNVVLMGASSQTLYDLVVEKTNRTILLARNYWDYDNDGRLSLEEVIIHPEAGLSMPNASSTSSDNLLGQEWYPGIDTDNDNMININNELTPFALTLLSQIEFDPWYQSHKQIHPTVEIIENLRRQNILILQGEKDIQTNIEQALLLEQKLTELKHPDHTLMTYNGLGYTFYPAEGPNELLGPIQDYVLADLHAWLKERSLQR